MKYLFGLLQKLNVWLFTLLFVRKCAHCSEDQTKSRLHKFYENGLDYILICADCWNALIDERHKNQQALKFEELVREELLRAEAREEAFRRLAAQKQPYRD